MYREIPCLARNSGLIPHATYRLSGFGIKGQSPGHPPDTETHNGANYNAAIVYAYKQKAQASSYAGALSLTLEPVPNPAPTSGLTLVWSDEFHGQYGRRELRAKTNNPTGAWPTTWTLGIQCQWPRNSDVDAMENYGEYLLANFAWATDQRRRPQWDSAHGPASRRIHP
jgi:hypothetical protein